MRKLVSVILLVAALLGVCLIVSGSSQLGNPETSIVKYSLKLSVNLTFDQFRAVMKERSGLDYSKDPYIIKPKSVEEYYCKLQSTTGFFIQCWWYSKTTGQCKVFTPAGGKAWSAESAKTLLSAMYALCKVK